MHGNLNRIANSIADKIKEALYGIPESEAMRRGRGVDMRKRSNQSLLRYRGSIPEVLRFRVILYIFLAGAGFLFQLARDTLFWTTNRSAATSGDLSYWLRSVQGWVLMLLGLLFIFMYVVFDIHALILLSERVLHQKPIRVREILKESFQAIGSYRQPFGIFLLLYVAFLVPLAGVGFGISLTENFHIPDFITSYIMANNLYRVLYYVLLTMIFLLSFCFIFTFHFMIFGKEKASTACRKAGGMMRGHWKNFLRCYLLFLIKTTLLGVVMVLVLGGILLVLSSVMPCNTQQQFRAMITFFSFVILLAAVLYVMLFAPFQVIELTRLYESYTEEDEGEILYPPKRRHPAMWCVLLVFVLLLALTAYMTADSFDSIFPAVGNTAVIAHRGGGSLANENTVAGVEAAIKAGANASEIDIQRTKDGYYIVNHDDTFQRLGGVSKVSSEMTLEEIKELSIPDNYNFGGKEEPFATLEEMLDAARGNLHLYVELKGATADSQMAEDAYEMVKERDMLSEVTFISLRYPLIQELELSHPDATTGYLCYASVGELEDLNVDVLILEEETATTGNIEKIQSAGKQVIVWTVENPISMLRFYSRNVDAIITDEVDQALEIRDVLTNIDGGEYQDEIEDMMRVLLHSVFVWWS